MAACIYTTVKNKKAVTELRTNFIVDLEVEVESKIFNY